MGLCQSDPRDHTKVVTVEIKPVNFGSSPADPNLESVESNSDSKSDEKIPDTDYFLRTNINLNELHPNLNLNKPNNPQSQKETYMDLILPTQSNNQAGPSSVSFSNAEHMFIGDRKPEERKTSSFLENNPNMPLKPSIYNRRISQMLMTNPLAQLNLTNSNTPVPMSQNVINEEPSRKVTDNSNEEDSLSLKRSNPPLAGSTGILNRGLTSKFQMESAMSLKKSNEHSHENFNRYNYHFSSTMYESKIFTNLAEENEQNKEDVLYVITVVSNPCQNSLKAQHYSDFVQRLEPISNVRLITVEVTYMGLPFILTEPHFEPYNIQMRIHTPLNLKYNFLNYVISILPPDAENIAWIDSNIEFLNESWVDDTLELLKSFNIVKLYQDCLIISKDSNILGSTTAVIKNPKNQKGYNHYEKIMMLEKYSGTAWAAKKEFITSVGGFLDLCVTNENDEIISACFEGKVDEVLSQNLAPEFRDVLKEWQKSIRFNNKNEEVKVSNNVAKKYLTGEHSESPRKKHNVKGSGSKNKNDIGGNRYTKYDGWALLCDYHFNPLKDLARDGMNVYQLKKEKEKMFKSFKEYFLQSNDLSFD